jgi:hypothetical protein
MYARRATPAPGSGAVCRQPMPLVQCPWLDC